MTVHCPWCGKECKSLATLKVHALQQFDDVHPDSKQTIMESMESIKRRLAQRRQVLQKD